MKKILKANPLTIINISDCQKKSREKYKIMGLALDSIAAVIVGSGCLSE